MKCRGVQASVCAMQTCIYFNSIAKWVCPHVQGSVSLYCVFISILSFVPGRIKLHFFFTIISSDNKGWNMRVQHLPERCFLQCENFCYLLWDNEFWFYNTIFKSWPIVQLLCLTKIFPVLRSWTTILALCKSLLILERQRLHLPYLIWSECLYLYKRTFAN